MWKLQVAVSTSNNHVNLYPMAKPLCGLGFLRLCRNTHNNLYAKERVWSLRTTPTYTCQSLSQKKKFPNYSQGSEWNLFITCQTQPSSRI